MVLHLASHTQPFTIHSSLLYILLYSHYMWKMVSGEQRHITFCGLIIWDMLTLACRAGPRGITCIPSRAPFGSCRILHSHTYCISQAYIFFLTCITILSTLPITLILFHKHSLSLCFSYILFDTLYCICCRTHMRVWWSSLYTTLMFPISSRVLTPRRRVWLMA